VNRLRVFTWHIHGHYLYYLAHCPHDFYIPVSAERRPGYAGKSPNFPWPPNLHEVPEAEVTRKDFDVVLFQHRRNREEDQYRTLSPAQRRLPSVYLEHDPPQEHPTNTRHFVDDPDVLLVHVTQFNALMWDSGRSPTRVIEHGVKLRDGVHYTGEQGRAIAVVNNIRFRGRRLGLDVYLEAATGLPLDLAGMGSESLPGGLGEIQPMRLAEVESKYRVFFNPIRYTSLGLAVCEAMMLGMPVVGLATTEMAAVVENGRSGFVTTDTRQLIDFTRHLLDHRSEARRLGAGARRLAEERFGIERFGRDWDETLRMVAGAPLRSRTLAVKG
jgi:hypothetical protein